MALRAGKTLMRMKMGHITVTLLLAGTFTKTLVYTIMESLCIFEDFVVSPFEFLCATLVLIVPDLGHWLPFILVISCMVTKLTFAIDLISYARS